MHHIDSLIINDFSYDLPEEKIARFPLANRDASKLLIYNKGNISENIFSNIGSYLPPESLVVFNNTRVINARMEFHRKTGARIEIFCLEPIAPFTEMQKAFGHKKQVTWKCLVGNARRWNDTTVEKTITVNGSRVTLTARKLEQRDDSFVVQFEWTPEHFTFSEIVEQFGIIPLPPYLHRKADKNDEIRYQTIYASVNGSVAAPTAGLHFTGKVLGKLQARNIFTENLTLHVGAGTFKPVSSQRISDHQMHTEQIIITINTLRNLIASSGKIISVGTTSLRTLESLYWYGLKITKNPGKVLPFAIMQWEPYENLPDPDISYETALKAIENSMTERNADTLYGSTQLMIIPGYRIRSSQILITNFHQPQSTLLLLIAAFIGNDWEKAYAYALENNFRFLSYGDSCLFIR
ncbi:MAG: S-adenosylmethionine:tRNA ribosyltransferase-isomerase [Lentimicrobiaceae bacterium]|jgi:S-adenosylmethionine:tRNA ribosyltransferase-isomerase|nr:S-adenosylmethionine:tRNA ribosyltransferase-isomerase [Lentimicrobiaceae bacterium]